MIEWKIDLGTLVQIAGFLGTIIYIAATVRNDIKAVKGHITDIQTELKALRDVMTTQATQTVRLDMLAKRFDKMDDDLRALRQGEGYILPLRGGRRGNFEEGLP